MKQTSARRKKVFAVSSGGGHWVQLLRLRPAFADCDVTYATVRAGYQADVDSGRFIRIVDCNRSRPWAALWSALVTAAVIFRVRPDVVVSTGALPGYLAIRIGRWFGAKTIWVDSVANVEELSMSGQRIGAHADLWLTQWPHLATQPGPKFWGSVL